MQLEAVPIVLHSFFSLTVYHSSADYKKQLYSIVFIILFYTIENKRAPPHCRVNTSISPAVSAMYLSRSRNPADNVAKS